MLFFNMRKAKKKKEAEIQAIKKDTLEKIDEANTSIKQVNRLLSRDDVTIQIFYATRKKGAK